MTRVDDYRAMLSKLTEAQSCAAKCAWENSCATCLVRAPMNAAREIAARLGENTIAGILIQVENQYSNWSWKEISHELTNALNAAKSAARAAETQSAADIQRAASHREYAVTTGVEARTSAQQQAAAQVAAREAADAEARRKEEARLAALRKAEAERLAAAAKIREQEARRRGDEAAAARAAQAAAQAEADAALHAQIMAQAGGENWFMALPMEHKLAVAGIGFGSLLLLIFAMKS